MKKKIASMFVAGLLLLSGTAFAYDDIDNHWAKTYIENMNDARVLDQFRGVKLFPDQSMTREECAVLISDFAERYFNYKPHYGEDNYKFPDLRDSMNSSKIRALSLLTYRSYMTYDTVSYPKAAPTRIINGYPTIGIYSQFNPNRTVTRAEFAKMLMNTVDCFGYMAASNYGQTASDADLHWGRHFLMLAYGYGIMNGYQTLLGEYTMYLEMEDRIHDFPVGMYIELKPDGLITRAEAIKMVASARELRYVGLEYSEGTTRPEGETKLYYLSE